MIGREENVSETTREGMKIRKIKRKKKGKEDRRERKGKKERGHQGSVASGRPSGVKNTNKTVRTATLVTPFQASVTKNKNPSRNCREYISNLLFP